MSSTDLSFAETAAPAPVAQDSCEILSRGPGVDLAGTEVTLHTQLEGILKDLKDKNFEGFAKYFHPRAKVKRDIGEKLESIINNRYEAPLQFTVFRVWRLKTPAAGKAIFNDCPEAEGARIVGSYGYEKQYAVWIQIMGQNELGRLIFSIAPDKGKDLIAGFRIQQWTQTGDGGELAESKQNAREAYFAYDISQKLVDGKDLVVYPVQAQLLRKRDEMFTQAKLLAAMNKDLGVDSIAYIGTLLAREGSGLFIREYLKAEKATTELHDMCLKRGRDLKAKSWLKESQGLRCNFLFKGMDPQKDSALGGFYFTPEDLKLSKK
ncbi:MAG: hypothetical protein EOP10_09790 [Proteobacteria bacterium]|nr:MAG: hypothetical protein EOP10_09790 [Pseudomonadota bacterium]